MPCCGESSQTRLTITQREIDEGMRLQIEYSGGGIVTVHGPVTGRQYAFSGLDRVQDVDPRDVPGILRGGSFRVKGIKRGGN